MPFEQVTLAQRPSPSTAVMWVVDPSRPAPGGLVEEAAGEPVDVEALEELLGARVLRHPHHLDQVLEPVPVSALEQRERVGDQDPARGRRRVGEHLATAKPRPHRLARDRLIGREVAAPERAAAVEHPVGDRRRDLAAVEGLRALVTEPLESVREIGEDDRVAGAEQAATRRVDRRRLGVVGQDRRQDREEEGLLGDHHVPLAGESGRRRRQLAQASGSRTARARPRARPASRGRRTMRPRRGTPAPTPA